MKSLIRSFVLSLSLLSSCATAPVTAQERSFGPVGWVEMCDRPDPETRYFCASREVREFPDTPANRALVETIHVAVNKGMQPADDLVTYGVQERWAMPVGLAGDCEDFVLLKIRMLRNAGVPASALLIIVGKSRLANTGHAVLGVKIGEEMLVLDNLVAKPLPLGSALINIKMVQTAEDPNQWDVLQ